MSALGQKQTFAPLSAYPRKRTLAAHYPMSALGQKSCSATKRIVIRSLRRRSAGDAAVRRGLAPWNESSNFVDCITGRSTAPNAHNIPPGAIRDVEAIGPDQVRVRIRIMKLSKPSSATCSHV